MEEFMIAMLFVWLVFAVIGLLVAAAATYISPTLDWLFDDEYEPEYPSCRFAATVATGIVFWPVTLAGAIAYVLATENRWAKARRKRDIPTNPPPGF